MISRASKIIFYFIVAAAGVLAVATPWLQAQDEYDFSPPRLSVEPVSPAPDFFPPASEEAPLQPGETGANPAVPPQNISPFEKRLAETPERLPKDFIDAADLRDPFALIPGYGDDAPEVLEPGTTIDGVRFFSYSHLDRFIETYYRKSGFSLKDVFGRTEYQEGNERCLTCHHGIEEISKNHKFSCTQCHGGDRRAFSRRAAHKGLVANPSSLQHAPKYCGKCHAGQIDKVNRSLMATAKGEINLTRYAWGAQSSGSPLLSLRPEESEILFPQEAEPRTVDGFLQKKCLRCHLQSPSPHRPGEYRSTGCSACHMVYTNDGLTVTRDRAIQAVQKAEVRKSKNRFSRNFAANSLNNNRGYPVRHKFTVAVPSVQCEHCHHNGGVGNEYEGLLPRPARPKPDMEKIDGARPTLYGAQHDFLLPDIHREKGMHCIDCHGAEEIKAPSYPTLHEALQIRCEDCHGTDAKAPEGFQLIASDPEAQAILKPLRLNPNLASKVKLGDVVLVNSQGVRMPHIKMEEGHWVLISKVTGKKHKVPVLKDLPVPAAHRVARHMESVECSACHARWSAAEWGKHVIYEEEPDTGRWQNWSFADPTLQNILSAPAGKENELDPKPASMLNWLTAQPSRKSIEGAWEPGVWWDLTVKSDPRTLILGKNSRGKYSVMKPRRQYFITQRWEAGAVEPETGETKPEAVPETTRVPITQDGTPGLIMVPYSPHTIRKSGRSCEGCHGNSLAAGLGDLKRSRVTDATLFLDTLKAGEPIPRQFQLQQMVADDGTPLQTTLFDKNVRFLNREEISALNEKSDRYRAYHYLSLRERGYPRLLTREEFPLDLRHKEKERLFFSSEENGAAENPPPNEPATTGPDISDEGIVEFSPDQQPQTSP
ncbi:MAG: hypothetical protein ACE5G9_03525 [Nitrospinales bacterium]